MDGTLIYTVLSDVVVLIHLAFIGFVLVGGVIAAVWPKIIWAHIPCMCWGILVELTGGLCPLTPLEVLLRQRSGQAAYSGDFVIHYIEPLIYPQNLTRELQIVFGTAVIVINLVVYSSLFLARKRIRL